ncbi:hydroxyacid-oxoacid transhydrogenase [Streptomyces sp. NPDC020379]|uniref:hydroxyacid-oxoacid transhydrogenase n=1 Tax=Streptomyces sp. NPDC020379 TaxID=3365071 RepID=UPI0037AF411C
MQTTRTHETVITWQAPPIRYGLHATQEIGHEIQQLGARSALIVTDPNLTRLELPQRVRALMEQEGVETAIFDEAEIEPTDRGCEEAAASLGKRDYDCYIGLGGGSSMDTAKMINLLRSCPGSGLRRYLNRPIGDGAPVPRPLKPLITVPTTAGSGSECTCMVALGVVSERVKTGISDPRLRPTAAVVDPWNTVTMPPAVTAASGYDVLTHACESYTARPYDRRPPYASPGVRPVYVGANPVSDVWAEQALTLVGRYLRRAVLNPYDIEARSGMSRAALFAGMGFGNAGTHIPHACAYPVAGLVTDYRPRDYRVDHPLVPHGESVIVTAPEAFAFTYATSPERHLRAAELLGASLDGTTVRNGVDLLPQTLLDIVADTGGPRGLSDFGYTARDIPALTEGAARQERLLACCPRDVDRSHLSGILARSLDHGTAAVI